MEKYFNISTDTCVDLFKSYLDAHNVYCITMKYVIDGHEIAEHYDSHREYDSFYEKLKKGAQPTTVALNQHEMQEHFQEILNKTQGDIIHIPLSSGLSVTCDNCIKAADEINKTLKGRKVYIFDSLLATAGMSHLVDELIKWRDAGKNTQETIEHITRFRSNQQGWALMSDLFNLKRGGRISGVKATIGTILNIKPIIVSTAKGKLAIENKMHGLKNAINYMVKKLQENGEQINKNFIENTCYFYYTSESPICEDLRAAIKQKYPNLKIKEGRVGPIIGTHLGCNAVMLVYEGAKRLDIV